MLEPSGASEGIHELLFTLTDFDRITGANCLLLHYFQIILFNFGETLIIIN